MIVTLPNGENRALPRVTPIWVDEDGQAITATGPDHRVTGLVRDTSIAAGERGRVSIAGVIPATYAQWAVVTGYGGGLVAGASYHLGPSGSLTCADTSGQLVGVALTSYALALRITDAPALDSTTQRIEELETQMAALVEWLCATGFDVPEVLITALED